LLARAADLAQHQLAGVAVDLFVGKTHALLDALCVSVRHPAVAAGFPKTVRQPPPNGVILSIRAADSRRTHRLSDAL
jgi:hypothetical protein